MDLLLLRAPSRPKAAQSGGVKGGVGERGAEEPIGVFYDRAKRRCEASAMTMRGALWKMTLLWGVSLLTAWAAWSVCRVWGLGSVGVWIGVGSLVGALASGLLTCFHEKWAAWTAVLFSGFEGGVFGVGVWLAEDVLFDSATVCAKSACAAFLAAMLVNRMGWMTTRSLGKCWLAVIGVGTVMAFSGGPLFEDVFSESGKGVSVFEVEDLLRVCLGLSVLSWVGLNQVLDLKTVEAGVRSGAPRHLEWYSAFAAVLSMLWLCVEGWRQIERVFYRND